MGDHVTYESRLELSRLLLADFAPNVRAIAAQPFMVAATVNGGLRRHIPDYLWDTVDGPVVVDIVRAERPAHPDVVLLCQWAREVVESLGWKYRVLSEPPRVAFDNIGIPGRPSSQLSNRRGSSSCDALSGTWFDRYVHRRR